LDLGLLRKSKPPPQGGNQYAGLTVLDAMSSPLSHALANVLKRAAVISMAVIYTRRPLTPLHVLGISLSIFGATLYRMWPRVHAVPHVNGETPAPSDEDSTAR